MLVATALIGATNVLAGAVQAHGRFGWSASEGVVFNLVMITVALAVGQRYGVTALAAAFVLGSAARLLVQLPAVRAAGMRLRPSLDLRDPGLREMAVLVPPLLVGSALANVSTLVDRAVGSAVGEGAITALSYGFRLVSLADTLFVAALATSLYPALARAAVPGREQEMAELVRRACGVLAILLAPVAVVLTFGARPAVDLLFGHGEFGADAVDLTATAVRWYAVGAVALAVRQPVTRAFYALGDTRTPTALVGIGVVVNVVGDLVLGLRFGVAGLAAATSLSFTVVAALSVWRLSRRVPVSGVLRCLRQVAVAAVAAAVVTALVLRAADGPAGLVLAAVACTATHAGVLRLLGCRELTETLGTLRGLAVRAG